MNFCGERSGQILVYSCQGAGAAWGAGEAARGGDYIPLALDKKRPPVCLVLWCGAAFERDGGRLSVSFCCPRGGVCHGAEIQTHVA